MIEVSPRGLDQPGAAPAFSSALIIGAADVRDIVERVGRTVDVLAVQLLRERITVVGGGEGVSGGFTIRR